MCKYYRLPLSVCCRFCFSQRLFELVYSWESCRKNKQGELFIETVYVRQQPTLQLKGNVYLCQMWERETSFEESVTEQKCPGMSRRKSVYSPYTFALSVYDGMFLECAAIWRNKQYIRNDSRLLVKVMKRKKEKKEVKLTKDPEFLHLATTSCIVYRSSGNFSLLSCHPLVRPRCLLFIIYDQSSVSFAMYIFSPKFLLCDRHFSSFHFL